MELNEAVRRILGQHKLLILVFLVIGVGVAATVHNGSTSYTASTRLVLDTADPKDRPESTSIADTAKAIATSPAQVRDALSDAKVSGRNPLDIANNDVSVTALGTSGVLQLSVTDRSAQPAADIANALARRLIDARLTISGGSLQQVLSSLNRQVDELGHKITSLDSQIALLEVAAATAGSPREANSLRAKQFAAERARDFLAQQRNVVESERVSLLSTVALRPKPTIISAARPPAHADSSHRVPVLILGVLLGLISGVGLAGLLETLRPTLVGGAALARELDTALLGTLPGDSNANSRQNLATLAVRLRLAAESADVENIELLATEGGVDLRGLAERIENLPKNAPVGPQGNGQDGAASLGVRVRPFSLENSSRRDGTGLVLVSPSRLKRDQLVDVAQMLRVMPLPLIGLITYKRRRRGTDP